MNDDELPDAPFPVLRSDGCLASEDYVCAPWPSLVTNPEQTVRFAEAIRRASVGSPIWPFVEKIPERVRRLVGAMPSRRGELLELCAEEPDRGTELIASCPALALLLVNEYRPARHGDRRAHFRAMMARGWRELLRALALPDQPGTIRLLEKLDPERVVS